MCLSQGWAFLGAWSSEDVWACMCSCGLAWRGGQAPSSCSWNSRLGDLERAAGRLSFQRAASNEALSLFQLWGHTGCLVLQLLPHGCPLLTFQSQGSDVVPSVPSLGWISKIQTQTLWRISACHDTRRTRNNQGHAGKVGNGIFPLPT